MSFYPPPALTTIGAAAAQNLSYEPLLLVQVNFVDGVTVAYFATDTVTYGGHSYLGCLLHNTLDRLQAVTAVGLDTFPSASIAIADPGATLFSQYEIGGPGFKGAIVTITLILVDKITGNTSSDAKILFYGRADPASSDDQVVTFKVTNKLSLQYTSAPNVPVSKLCPWVFPTTAADRAAGTLSVSKFYPCGYLDGGGNNDPTTGAPFDFCNYDKQSCNDRGMFSVGRFGAVQWEPAAAWSNPHIYTTGQKGSGWNTDNQSKYNSYVPVNYGPGQIQGIVANVLGDGNTVRFEVIVGFGNMINSWDGGIQLVIVDNVVVPHNPGDPMFPTPAVANSGFSPTFMWQYVNIGSRNGTPNQLIPWNGSTGSPGYNSGGDPYGSMTVIAVVVETTIQSDSNSVPNVLAITSNGKGVRVYNTPTSFVDNYFSNSNPVWILMDLLVSTGPYTYADFDLQTAIDAAAVCSTLVAYSGVGGAYDTSGVSIDDTGVTVNIQSTSGGTFVETTIGIQDYVGNSVYVGELLQIGALSIIQINAGVNVRIDSIDSDTQITLASPGIGTIPTWSSATTYGIGDFVNYTASGATVTYQCVQGCINVKPVGSLPFWGPVVIEVSHNRYRLNLVMQQRQPLSDIINSVKLGCNLSIVVNNETNLLQFYIDQGLGDQQPAPITGSNDNSAYASYLATGPNAGDGTGGVVDYQADGRVGVGYVAYSFDESNILLEGNEPNYRSSLKITQLPSSNTPNRIIVPFQNEAIYCVSDTGTRVDTDDYARMNQTYDSTVQMDGIPNYDQIFRRANNYMARNYRGNPRSPSTYGDTGGTFIIELKTTGLKVGHLRIGQIVSVSSILYGLTKQLFRIISIQASDNFTTAILTMKWHDDRWFVDGYGNGPSPLLSMSASTLQGGVPRGWIAYGGSQPLSGDPVFTSQEYWLPAITIFYTPLADSSVQALLRVSGRLPVNYPTSATFTPFITQQGTVDVSSGTVPAGDYYIVVVAMDDINTPTYPQAKAQMCRVSLLATGSLIVPKIVWQPFAARGAYFVGRHSHRLEFQGFLELTPANVTVAITAVNNVSTVLEFTVASTDSMITGQFWNITGVTGSGFIVGNYAVNIIDPTTFALQDFVASGSYSLSSAQAALQQLPTSLTIANLGGAINPAVNSFPVPDPQFYAAQTAVKLVRHAGPVGSVVDSVASFSITKVGAGFATNQWAGYAMSVIGLPLAVTGTAIPVFNATIVSNTNDTLTLSVDPLTSGITQGCVFTIYSNPTIGSDRNGNVVLTDANWVNSLGPIQNPIPVGEIFRQRHPVAAFYVITTTIPHGFSTGDTVTFNFPADPTLNITLPIFNVTATTFETGAASGFLPSDPTTPFSSVSAGAICYIPGGLTVKGEVGNLLRVWYPNGTSQTSKIIDNGPTFIKVPPMLVTPSNGCITSIEEPDWHYVGQAQNAIAGASPLNTTDLDAVISNYEGQQILVQTALFNSSGQQSPPSQTPFRMVYVSGKASSFVSQGNPGYYIITPTAAPTSGFVIAVVDFSNNTFASTQGLNQRVVLSANRTIITAPTWSGGTIVSGVSFSLYIDQDGTGGRPAPLFAQNWAQSTTYNDTTTPNPSVLVDFNNHTQLCTTSGVSSAFSQPTWNSTGGITSPDGTVSWTDQGPIGSLPAYGGYASNTGTIVQMDGTPNTRTCLTFTLHVDINDYYVWVLDSQTTGNALI